MNKISNWSQEMFSDFLKNKLNRAEKVIGTDIAGEGNMNCTLRVTTDRSSYIFKQSPPYCEKFPSVPAPEERIISEAKFYELAGEINSLKNNLPDIFFLDKDQKILVMEDLGVGTDYENLYTGKRIPINDLEEIITFMSHLHKKRYESDAFKNTAMRNLNFDYIFKLPFVDQSQIIDLDTITPGLKDIGLKYSMDKELINKVNQLGEIYLGDGESLLHGDFYPRSWLKSNNKNYIIDSEFGFIGQKEFELGVFLAHMAMSSQLQNTLEVFESKYCQKYDSELVAAFTGLEILRRNLCIAQLPVKNDLELKRDWLIKSRHLVVKKDYNTLRDFK